jgi:hypothetical protein
MAADASPKPVHDGVNGGCFWKVRCTHVDLTPQVDRRNGKVGGCRFARPLCPESTFAAPPFPSCRGASHARANPVPTLPREHEHSASVTRRPWRR